MNIIIQSITDVTVDGVPKGGVVDVLFNAASKGDESLRGPMLDALNSFVASVTTARDARIAALEAELTEAKAVITKGVTDILSGDSAALAGLVERAAKSVEDRQREAAQSRLAAANQEAAAAQADLDALK